MSDMPEKLLPCPFCGGEADIEQKEYRGLMFWHAYCSKCGSQSNGHRDDKKVVSDLWNTRADLAPKWQPIETAPKDDVILLLDAEYNTIIQALYNIDRWIDATQECNASHDIDDLEGIRKGFNPSHWMPLPKPPKGI